MPCYKCKRKISLGELLSVAKCKGCMNVFCSQHRGQEHETNCIEYKKFVAKKKADADTTLLQSSTKPTKLDLI